jgi:hypothetical protein
MNITTIKKGTLIVNLLVVTELLALTGTADYPLRLRHRMLRFPPAEH